MRFRETEYTNDVVIYTDGSALNNPNGPGGYGTIIELTALTGEKQQFEYSKGYKLTTNNRMELMAAIAGLYLISQDRCNVKLYSDSQYLVKAFNEKWIDSWVRKGWRRGKNEPVANVDLWQFILALVERQNVEFVWVKGHANNKGNERCDKLATTAARGNDLTDDVGFKK